MFEIVDTYGFPFLRDRATDSGGTERVRFHDLTADGRSLDDKRTPLLAPDKLGVPAELTDDEHEHSNLSDVLARWADHPVPSRSVQDREQVASKPLNAKTVEISRIV